MSALDLLQAAKAAAGVSSDYALAKVLGVSRFAVSGYVCGRTLPDALVAFRIARLIGDDPSHVIALIELERAQRKRDDETAAAWQSELSEHWPEPKPKGKRATGKTPSPFPVDLPSEESVSDATSHTVYCGRIANRERAMGALIRDMRRKAAARPGPTRDCPSCAAS